MGSNRPIDFSCFLDGAPLSLAHSSSVGAALLKHVDGGALVPRPGEPPYLFCGNGSCRDCALLVDGIPDVASCRIPLAAGLSLRRGAGAGEPNALSRRLSAWNWGAPLSCDVVVVGGGRSGRAAAARRRAKGAHVVLLEARPDRARRPIPAGVHEGTLVAFEEARVRRIDAVEVVLATGARDRPPEFPGAFLAGVVPMDLCERYAALGFPVGLSVVLSGEKDRAMALASALRDAGAERVMVVGEVRSASGDAWVESVSDAEGATFSADIVAVAGDRVPRIEIGKALGCRARYSHARGYDALELTEAGASSVSGVSAVGSAAIQ